MRRSFLFLPGNTPNLLVNGNVLGADAVIFDLEDAVSPDEKDSARILVRNTLRYMDFSGIETVVRINSIDTPYWKRDLGEILPEKPQAVLLPKVNGPRDIETLCAYIDKSEKDLDIPKNTIKLYPLIETALGLENALKTALASDRLAGLVLGAEDLTADLGCKRTKEGKEIEYARSRMVACARAASLDVIDTPFTDVNDEEGIYEDCRHAKGLGFTGKLSISPRHIQAINEVFSPSRADIDHAYRVMDAIRKAKEEGRGVVALDGKMIDAPVVSRAEQTIKAAEALGLGKEEFK
jgi:citrate lyase subunit beta/citryl-CoA lyase